MNIEDLTSKKFYTFFLNKNKKKPTSEGTINAKFTNTSFAWNKIYMSARKATLDCYTRMFHFKVTHNILYLNKALYNMGKADSPRCSYCNLHDETVDHLYCNCFVTRSLWSGLKNLLPLLNLPDLTPQSAYVGLPYESDAIQIHIHLIFKICLYKSRESKKCNLMFIKNKIKQIRQLELKISAFDAKKSLYNRAKWSRLDMLT